MKKDGIEALFFAGIVIFTLANGLLVYESLKNMCGDPNKEMLSILRRIDKKLLSNAKHKS